MTGAICCLGFSTYVMALPSQTITAEERALLPKWCMFTQTFDTRKKRAGHYETYLKRYGSGWSHAHHVCWSLVAMQRYRNSSATQRDRDFLARNAVGDLNYVLINAPPDFFMRFDINYKKAKIYLLQRKYADARKVAANMIAKWPERADSHGVLAQAFYEEGKVGEARKALDTAEGKVVDKQRLARYRKVLKLPSQ
ncbi:MAG: tetratricopeptide repeat protein [Burkholderiaceae bacterium]